MAAEVDDFPSCNVERVILAGVSACSDSEGVMSWIERRLDGFMPFE